SSDGSATPEYPRAAASLVPGTSHGAVTKRIWHTSVLTSSATMEVQGSVKAVVKLMETGDTAPMPVAARVRLPPHASDVGDAARGNSSGACAEAFSRP